jgi:hypothetical protein
MSKCITLKCNNKEMTQQEREKEFQSGWVGITMHDHICLNCFELLKKEI